jgi:2-methylisocitrate lyase-like PEP mutase family enzyme
MNDKARLLKSLHEDLLVLPNAWDVPSAAVIALAGARAIATTSAGIAWSLGRPDGHRLGLDEAVAVIARIVAAAGGLPVTADLENGYGESPSEVAATVTAAIEAGAVGGNLEDSRDGGLHTPEEQAARIAAARAAAVTAGVPDFVINARTDVHFHQIGDPSGRDAEVRARARAYAEAGADCLFVPGLLDLTALAALTAAVDLPVNAMAGPGGPAVKELVAAGVRRISLGAAVHLAAYATAHQAAVEVLAEGTYDRFPDMTVIAPAVVRL